MIKLLLTATLLLAFAFGAAAQVQQGATVLTGVFHLNTYRTETGNSTSSSQDIFQVSQKYERTGIYTRPSFGYLIKDNIEVGIALGLQYFITNTDQTISYFGEEKDSNSRVKTTGYEFRPYIQKYFFLSDRFAFIPRASIGYTSQKDRSTYHKFGTVGTDVFPVQGESTATTGYVSANLSPGIAFFVSERINLNASLEGLSYVRYTNKDNNPNVGPYKSGYNTFGVNLSAQYFTFGLSYFISR